MRVVLPRSDHLTLARRLFHEGDEEFVADGHLFGAALTDFVGSGNAFLDFTVFLLFGEFVLNGEFGLVDEGLFFEVEVVLGLHFDGFRGEREQGLRYLMRTFQWIEKDD